MVAKDGGIFTFGKVPFYGSLPGFGITANDVIGMARTPSDLGYYIARSTGEVYGIGITPAYGSSNCNPIAAIFSNPAGLGYRLVTESGATLPFGRAPGGGVPTGNPEICPNYSPYISLAQYDSIQVGESYPQIASLLGDGGLVGTWVPHPVTRTYQWGGAGFMAYGGPNNPTATITFHNNRVIAKTEIGLT